MVEREVVEAKQISKQADDITLYSTLLADLHTLSYFFLHFHRTRVLPRYNILTCCRSLKI